MDNPGIRTSKYSKYCVVPSCRNTSIRTPNKLFVSMPSGIKQLKRRNLWLKAMGRRVNDISLQTKCFVCENHFNLEEDMANYLRWKMMGGYIVLKKNVVPHILIHQENNKSDIPPARNNTKKPDHHEIITNLLQEGRQEADIDLNSKEQESEINLGHYINIKKEYDADQVFYQQLVKPETVLNNIDQRSKQKPSVHLKIKEEVEDSLLLDGQEASIEGNIKIKKECTTSEDVVDQKIHIEYESNNVGELTNCHTCTNIKNCENSLCNNKFVEHYTKIKEEFIASEYNENEELNLQFEFVKCE